MTRRPLFTAEELAEIARADAEIERQPITLAEIREIGARDKAIKYEAKPGDIEKENKRHREWRRKNIEKESARNKADYAKNREKRRAQRRANYLKHRGEQIAYQRAYREEKKREREQAAALQGG